jgi:hypothetical protein
MSEAGINYSIGLFFAGFLLALMGGFIGDVGKHPRIANWMYITGGLLALPLLARLIIGAVTL